MTQAFGVVLAGMLALVIVFAYWFVFVDELNELAPINRGDGFTPFRRHCVEMVLIGMSSFLTAIAIYFRIAESPDGPRLDWPKVQNMLIWLHVISGGVILSGLILAAAQGQPIHVRDGLTAVAGVVLLAFSAWDYFAPTDLDP